MFLFENPYKGISIVWNNIQRKKQSPFGQMSENVYYQTLFSLFVNLSRTCSIKPFTLSYHIYQRESLTHKSNVWTKQRHHIKKNRLVNGMYHLPCLSG
jgi:hypothetical protein